MWKNDEDVFIVNKQWTVSHKTFNLYIYRKLENKRVWTHKEPNNACPR